LIQASPVFSFRPDTENVIRKTKKYVNNEIQSACNLFLFSTILTQLPRIRPVTVARPATYFSAVCFIENGAYSSKENSETALQSTFKPLRYLSSNRLAVYDQLSRERGKRDKQTKLELFLLVRHATAVAAKLCLQIEKVRIIVVLWKRFRIQSILSRYIVTLKF